MTSEDFQNLQPGDIVEHKQSKETYVVQAAFKNRATAIKIADLSNSEEWNLVNKVTKRENRRP